VVENVILNYSRIGQLILTRLTQWIGDSLQGEKMAVALRWWQFHPVQSLKCLQFYGFLTSAWGNDDKGGVLEIICFTFNFSILPHIQASWIYKLTVMYLVSFRLWLLYP